MAHNLTPAVANRRPEIELLLCCAQTCVDSERAQRIKNLLQEHLDWSYLVRTACQQGVMPLMYHSLKTLCPEAVPPSMFAQLRVLFLASASHNQLLTEELLRLLHVWQSHGIPAIPFKGPTLAAAIY